MNAWPRGGWVEELRLSLGKTKQSALGIYLKRKRVVQTVVPELRRMEAASDVILWALG